MWVVVGWLSLNRAAVANAGCEPNDNCAALFRACAPKAGFVMPSDGCVVTSLDLDKVENGCVVPMVGCAGVEKD